MKLLSKQAVREKCLYSPAHIARLEKDNKISIEFNEAKTMLIKIL